MNNKAIESIALALHTEGSHNHRPNIYHRWLIKQRIYCENVRCGMVPATHVRKINGKDYVFCDEHCTRLDAARKSDKRQEKDAYGNEILSF